MRPCSAYTIRLIIFIDIVDSFYDPTENVFAQFIILFILRREIKNNENVNVKISQNTFSARSAFRQM